MGLQHGADSLPSGQFSQVWNVLRSSVEHKLLPFSFWKDVFRTVGPVILTIFYSCYCILKAQPPIPCVTPSFQTSLVSKHCFKHCFIIAWDWVFQCLRIISIYTSYGFIAYIFDYNYWLWWRHLAGINVREEVTDERLLRGAAPRRVERQHPVEQVQSSSR